MKWTTVNPAMNGFGYDDAGNVTNDTVNRYLYDPEGRICAVQGAPVAGVTPMMGYLYDAEGNRIAKGTITTWGSCDPAANGFQLTETYVLDQSGEESSQLSTQNGTTTWERSNVYGAGRLLATYDAAGLHFHLTDPLGTRRVQTDSNGVAETECQSLPYGDQLNCSQVNNAPLSADDSTPLHFTAKERDTESGNDYFGARYYSSVMGRFLSPDPSQLYFADLANPQSFNLYSYAYNNPLINIDPSGMDACATDNGNGTATIVNATDGGGVDCSGNGFYITTTQQVTGVGFNGNGDLSVYGADGNLYNPDGSAYDVAQSISVSANGNSSYIGPTAISSPGFQYVVTKPGPYNGPNNGRSYSRADVCAASALLHKGTATGLDAVGIIPGEGNALKAVQAGAGVVSAGMAVAGPGTNPVNKDVALSGAGLGLTAVDTAKVFEEGTEAAKAIPIAGNLLSIYATYSDLKEMSEYYDDCMAGKN